MVVIYPNLKSVLETPPSTSGMQTGTVRVTDGDTIQLGNTKIRLHGIDAPESKQSCYTANETLYACGTKSTAQLKRLIGNNKVSCEGTEKDRFGRLIAVCFAGEKNLNAEMVRSGWAIAYRYYSKDFVSQEASAKSNRLGIWQGRFVEPYQWRRSKSN